MESNTSKYKLEQDGKVYMLTTSIVGKKIRLACKNSSSPKNKKYSRDFSVDQLRKLDKLFDILKSPLSAIQYIDEALRQQKVGVTEENNGIKITFYITTKGITNQIDIPLGETSTTSKNSNGSQYIQTNEKVENYDNFKTNNYDQFLQGSEFTLPNENNNVDYNQYPTTTPSHIETNTNIYTTEQNTPNDTEFDINKYFTDIKTNTETTPYISPADNPEKDINQYFQQYQTVENTNVNINTTDTNDINQYTSEYTEQNVNSDMNFDQQIKQILQQTNVNINEINENVITAQSPEKEIKKESKPLTTTKVLPVKTTTRILPPIGPFTNLEGLDLHKLGIMNSEHQKMPSYEQMISPEITVPQTETKTNYYEINNQVITQPEIFTTGETKTITTTIKTNLNNDFNLNANNLYLTDNNINTVSTQKQISTNETELINNIKTENISLKKQISELRRSQSELKNSSSTKNQLAELESLRKKVAEFEILKGQLKELNSLRVEVAEYRAVKGQLKELNSLREKVNIQNKEIALLKAKVAEADKLKLRVEELNQIKNKYEQDIQGLEKSMRLYSIKASAKEEKEIIDEDTPEEITVKGDIIHDINELELITKKINLNNQKLTLNLLYKATADSDKAAAFHAKCDEAKSSIVLVETKKGKRFGGFTACSWSGDCIDKKDEEAFIFSLDKMKNYDNIPGEEAEKELLETFSEALIHYKDEEEE